MFTVTHEMHFTTPWRVIAPAGYVVARSHDKQWADTIARAMNAHAPMLAALERAETYIGEDAGPDFHADEYTTLGIIRAAIAKAKGGDA
jgi:hypothetical protein